jgi:hypothetical protein
VSDVVVGALIALGGGVAGALIVTLKDIALQGRQEQAAATAWTRKQAAERAVWLREERLAAYIAFLRAGDAYGRAVAYYAALRSEPDVDPREVTQAADGEMNSLEAWSDTMAAIHLAGGDDVVGAAERYIGARRDPNEDSKAWVSRGVRFRAEFVNAATEELGSADPHRWPEPPDEVAPRRPRRRWA